MSREREAPHAHDFAGPPSGSRGKRWYVVASLPKAERRAHAALHRQGFEPYLPLITVRLPDRHYRTIALWPGYLFTRLDLSRPWHPVLHSPGVYCLLSIDGIPIPCPSGLVEAVQAGEAERALPHHQTTAQWAPGALCSPANGILAGHRAVVLSVHRETVRVALMMFGHLREVQLDLDAIRPWQEP